MHTYDVRWTNFSGRAPYQSGGVVQDRDLWGSTGNGSGAFPRLFVYAAAFGRAQYRVDGTIAKDPTDLADDFAAIFFVARGQYRDPTSHRIETHDRNHTYDPAKPDDAYVSRIGAQAALLLYASTGELYRYYEFNTIHITRNG